MTDDNTIPMLTLAQVARRWNCSRAYVRAQVNAGNLPAVRFGRRWLRFATTAIERHERAHAVRPNVDAAHDQVAAA